MLLWNRGPVRSAGEEQCRCHQVSMDFLWKEYLRDPLQCCNSAVGPAYPALKHKFAKHSLWIDAWHSPPSWGDKELRNSRPPAQDGNLRTTHEQVMRIQGKSLLCNDDATSFVASLRTYALKKDMYRGTRAHDDILKQGLVEPCVDSLVTMYVKCGALSKAREVLDMHKSGNVSSWTALIAGYAQQGQGQDALNCFERMQRKGLSPDAVTYACILKACGSIGAADKGGKFHDEIVRQGLLRNDIVLGTALVDMYAKCGVLAKARQVLEELPSRNVITWSALIAGYVQHGQGEQALTCFEQMKQEGLSPNAVTFTSILKACGSIGAAEKGEQIHDEIVRQGLLGSNFVLGTALVDMYAKCGALERAQRLLEEIPSRNVITWSALITGYAQQGQDEQALNCFERMQNEGLSPTAVTFACILKACGGLGAADKGEKIHDEISRQGLLRNDFVLGTALVDMYAKCGALAKARQVLGELPSRNVTSWNALIAGYAQQGQGEQALNCFDLMQCEGLSPNAVTFTCVLNVCSHLGLVEDCYTYFLNMRTKYGVTPELEHYTCMVDLFGRAGHLDRAARVIQEMPSSDYSAVWSALLGACQKWGDVSVGRWAFEHAVQVDKSDAGVYVLMANIYAAAGMQEDAENIVAMRTRNKAWDRV